MSDVLIRDVTMRDGLQDCAPIPTEAKLAIYAALRAARVPELELTSFARPDRVPAMADAEQVAAATADDGIVRWGLVLNRRGAERALAAGMRHLQFVYSVSQAHNLENTGLTVAQSQAQLADVAALALEAGARIEVTLATAFGCPFDGPVDPEAVRRAAAAARETGVTGIGLADTIGTAVPTEVGRLFRAVVADHPDLPVGSAPARHPRPGHRQRARGPRSRRRAPGRQRRRARRLPVRPRCVGQPRPGGSGARADQYGHQHRGRCRRAHRRRRTCLRASRSLGRQPRRRRRAALRPPRHSLTPVAIAGGVLGPTDIGRRGPGLLA